MNDIPKDEIAKATEFLNSFKKKLEGAQREKFIFLLVGRTGVGKSSTVNTLMGKEVAKVGDYEATTLSVESYESEAHGVRFTVVDTPGLCDDLEYKGNDEDHLNKIRSKVSRFDCMWFVTRLDDTRVTSDEKRGIKLITESFGKKAWDHAIIVFTFANNPIPSKYPYPDFLKKRTEKIREEIAKYIGNRAASEIPSVAVDNESLTTPDGKEWLGELYVNVFTKISDHGLLPFYLATVSRIETPQKEQEDKNTAYYDDELWRKQHRAPRIKHSEATYHDDEIRKYDFEIEYKENRIKKTVSSRPHTVSQPIRLNVDQGGKIRDRLTSAGIISGTAISGAAIGATFGPVGALVGGAIGLGIGVFASLFKGK